MDITFPVLDPEATDSTTIIRQKTGVSWRGVVTAAADYTAGGESGFAGQEWDTDSNAPTHDVDSNAPVKDTDS